MESKNLEFEELAIAEAVGLTLHGLDFVVDAFQRAGRNAVVVEGEDAVAVVCQDASKLLHHTYARRLGTADPIVEDSASHGLAVLPPDFTHVFLELVGDGQRSVESHSVLQALLL